MKERKTRNENNIFAIFSSSFCFFFFIYYIILELLHFVYFIRVEFSLGCCLIGSMWWMWSKQIYDKMLFIYSFWRTLNWKKTRMPMVFFYFFSISLSLSLFSLLLKFFIQFHECYRIFSKVHYVLFTLLLSLATESQRAVKLLFDINYNKIWH